MRGKRGENHPKTEFNHANKRREVFRQVGEPAWVKRRG